MRRIPYHGVSRAGRRINAGRDLAGRQGMGFGDLSTDIPDFSTSNVTQLDEIVVTAAPTASVTATPSNAIDWSTYLAPAVNALNVTPPALSTALPSFTPAGADPWAALLAQIKKILAGLHIGVSSGGATSGVTPPAGAAASKGAASTSANPEVMLFLLGGGLVLLTVALSSGGRRHRR